MKKWVLLSVIIAVASLLFFTSDTFAFCRRACRGSICNVSHCATPIVHPVTPVIPVVPIVQDVVAFAYPVLVQFQFQYIPTAYAAPVTPIGYGQPAYPVGYGQGGYPVVPQQPAFQGQPYGYPPQGQPAFQGQQSHNIGLNKDKIRELARALIEEMNKQSDGSPESNQGPPAVPGTQQQSNLPQQQNGDLAQLAVNSLGKNCSSCHTGVGAKKDVMLFPQLGLFKPNVSLNKIKDEIEKGHMPPKDSQFHLNIKEKSDVLNWLKSLGVN